MSCSTCTHDRRCEIVHRTYCPVRYCDVNPSHDPTTALRSTNRTRSVDFALCISSVTVPRAPPVSGVLQLVPVLCGVQWPVGHRLWCFYIVLSGRPRDSVSAPVRPRSAHPPAGDAPPGCRRGEAARPRRGHGCRVPTTRRRCWVRHAIGIANWGHVRPPRTVFSRIVGIGGSSTVVATGTAMLPMGTARTPNC